MSFKSKNLSYERQTPTFLRRLQGDAADLDTANAAADRAAKRAQRLSKPRKNVEDDDDENAPTYLMEDGQATVSRQEFEEMTRDAPAETGSELSGRRGEDEHARKSEEETEEKRQTFAEVGVSSRKRKLGKVVGRVNEDEADHEGESNKAIDKSKVTLPSDRTTCDAVDGSNKRVAHPKKDNDKVKKKAKKRSKAIKLAFVEDEEG